MYKNLNTGAIGIKDTSTQQDIQLAAETGYAGIDFDIRDAAKLVDTRGVDSVRALFSDADILPGQWGLPVAWNNEDTWKTELVQLPRLATVGVGLGCIRVATWCPSWSDTRDYDENFAWHVERFRAIAQVLADAGCAFGIEFLGPKTLRDGHKYEFIYTVGQMMDLARAIGTGNVGLLLDAWHLFTSGGSIADLDDLTAKDIVTVHINDAPKDRSWDEMIDSDRRLPMETGVLDLVGFMQKLDSIGYDGPVTTEPFSTRINEIAANDPTRAAQEVSEAMDELWQASGLA